MPLSRFETLARQLVEESFGRLLGSGLEPLEVATRVARALEDSQAQGQAADLYRIHLHPDDYASVNRRNAELAAELVDYVVQLARQAGLSLPTKPQMELMADAAVRRHHVRVEAGHSQQAKEETTQVFRPPSRMEEALAALREVDAFLVIEGRRHVPLDRPLMTLGRRTDSNIVLDSPSVSRRHAQIRWRYGRFVLYDLSGRGRTVVNGRPVSEYALQPGDVIALSGELIVYGEGYEEARQRPRISPDEEEQTLIMPDKD